MVLGVASLPSHLWPINARIIKVIEFDSSHASGKFLIHLEQFMKEHGKILRIIYALPEAIIQSAETREKRRKKLDHFFREAYSKAFNRSAFHDRQLNEVFLDVPETVLNTSLTRSDFAAALGLHEDDDFVGRIFRAVASQQPDRISFGEFLEMVKLFARGSNVEKLKIIFDLCDRDQTGSVDRQEFCDLMQSVVHTAGVQLPDDQQRELVNEILQASGLWILFY